MFISLYLHTDALNTDPESCPPEVKPRPMKTIYRSFLFVTDIHVTHRLLIHSSVVTTLFTVVKKDGYSCLLES